MKIMPLMPLFYSQARTLYTQLPAEKKRDDYSRRTRRLSYEQGEETKFHSQKKLLALMDTVNSIAVAISDHLFNLMVGLNG